MPQSSVPFTSDPCEPRFVVWDFTQDIEIESETVSFRILIKKMEKSSGITQDWDTYWITLFLDGLASDEAIEYRQTNEFDYTAYTPTDPLAVWRFFPPDLLNSTISPTVAYPIAWDRDAPGPPFVPGM